jgi:MFS family permease
MLNGELSDSHLDSEKQDFEINEETAVCEIEEPSLSKPRVFLLNVSWFGLNAMYLVLSIEVFPSQVHALVGSEDKGQVLGAMIALGAVVTFFVSPLIGMKSDRLVFKYGRRRPFMVAGMSLLVIALFGMAFSAPYVENEKGNSSCAIALEVKRCLPYLNLTMLEEEERNNSADVDVLLNILSQKDAEGNVVMYVVFYAMVMACYALVSVPYNGLIADLTPPLQRGFSSGVMGAMTLAGNITGAAIGLFFFRLGVVGIYSLVSFVFVICLLITVFCSSETPLTEEPESLGFKGLFLFPPVVTLDQ